MNALPPDKTIKRVHGCAAMRVVQYNEHLGDWVEQGTGSGPHHHSPSSECCEAYLVLADIIDQKVHILEEHISNTGIVNHVDIAKWELSDLQPLIRTTDEKQLPWRLFGSTGTNNMQMSMQHC